MRKLGCLLVLIAAIVLAGFVAANMWAGTGPAERPVTVVVPQGASLARAATELEQAGAIRSATRLIRLVSATDEPPYFCTTMPDM